MYGASCRVHVTVNTEKERKERVWRRSRLLFLCAQRLQQYAYRYGLAVVVSNQMVSRTVWLPMRQDMTEPHIRSSASATAMAMSNSSDSRVSHHRDYHNNNNRNTVGGSGVGEDYSTCDGRAHGGRWEEMQKAKILVPALGDAWAHSLSTRVLLSFHHYIAPDGSDRHVCQTTPHAADRAAVQCDAEDRVTVYRAHKRERGAVAEGLGGCVGDTGDGYRGVAVVDDVHQHRVARLIKSTTQPRAECCFAIYRGGICDIY